MFRTKRAKRSKFCGSKSSLYICRYVNDLRMYVVLGDDDEVIIVLLFESEFCDLVLGELMFFVFIEDESRVNGFVGDGEMFVYCLYV